MKERDLETKEEELIWLKTSMQVEGWRRRNPR